MHTLKRQSNGQPMILLPAYKIGGGGEGDVYSVPNDPTLVAKVYFPNKLTGKEAKLKAMLASPPADPTKQKYGHTSIAWPVDLLLDASNQMAGYLMPNAQGMDKIFNYYVPPERQKRHPGLTYRHLLGIAGNLASAVSALHSSGYVIGDINESNAMVKDTSLVTLIDTDSFQVPVLNGKLHRCEVGKEEFTPPELQGLQFSAVDRQPEHDLFGLSVLFFLLLMEGANPFDGKYLGSGNPPPISERIKQGFFPHSRSRTVPFQAKPIAPPMAMLFPAVHRLFLQCFDDGHSNPQARPTAWVWHNELRNALRNLTDCSVQPKRHCYDASLASCPWCERALKFRVDFFLPSKQAVAVAAAGRKGKKKAKPAPPPLTPPVINSFRVGQSSITAGQSVVLSWDVANAQSVTIVGLGNYAAKGSVSVSPTLDTTYVIEARNGTYLVTRAVTITVTPPAPVINTFQAGSNSITAGQSVTLSWDVAHAQSVSIQGIGIVAAQGSLTVSPTADITYVIEARGQGAPAVSALSVRVKPAPVDIVLFQASQHTIHKGAGVTLQWQVNQAQTVSIDPWLGSYLLLQGSQVVYPLTDTTYTLTARGALGEDQRRVTIKVSTGLTPVAKLNKVTVKLRDPVKLKKY